MVARSSVLVLIDLLVHREILQERTEGDVMDPWSQCAHASW